MIAPLSAPTLYFIGVTTAQSSAWRIYPEWAKMLGIEAQLVGCDVPLRAPAEVYRRIIQHIKTDPLAVGGLVTTHKIDIVNAARDLFDYFDSNARLCGEISAISKHGSRLGGHARDPISSGRTWEQFVPRGHFARTRADVLCLGGGGAAVAISVYAARLPSEDRPRKFMLVDISHARLDHARAIHAQLDTGLQFEYILNADAARNDALLAALPAGSMVINATGMGKDLPGSPITDSAMFPQDGLVWELNYRGELDFLHQAERQSAAQSLIVEDGWVYFLHGWTQVMQAVFDFDLTPEVFAQLAEAASALR